MCGSRAGTAMKYNEMLTCFQTKTFSFRFFFLLLSLKEQKESGLSLSK